MKVVFYTNNISPHQLPLAREVMRRVGRENFLYVGEEIAWRGRTIDAGEVRTLARGVPEASEWLENADVMYTGGLRPIDLLERRSERGLKSFYYSERWFKPVGIVRLFGLFECSIPGWVRMLVPSYRRMAKRFVKLANENDSVKFLPVGPWARLDFIRLGVRPGKFIPWGYFVAPSVAVATPRGERAAGTVKMLWCGRMLDLKRAETIVRAVQAVEGCGLKSEGGVHLTLVGEGPEKGRLMKMVEEVERKGGQWNSPLRFDFLPALPLEKIRELMRQHDLYVLASDANEGWGAVLNEALEEGMSALGTFEAGASAAMLPQERLYHAGDWRALARLIEREMRGELPPCSIGDWTAAAAARRLLSGAWP